MNFRELVSADKNINDAFKSLHPKEILVYRDLPNNFIPASDDFFKEQFYWDSYFIMLGVARFGDEGAGIIRQIIENMMYLLDKYGYIPNSSHNYTTRSQPPFFAHACKLYYELTGDDKWLEEMYPYIVTEYEQVWTKEDSDKYVKETKLSRYIDFSDPHNEQWGEWYGAEQESGWDNTSRFDEAAHEVNAIDLNCLLFDYENILTGFARKLNRQEEFGLWKRKQSERLVQINKYCWSEELQFFFDYNFEKHKQLRTYSLAGYFPMFTNLATKEQAKGPVANLPKFEFEYGLATTAKDHANLEKQWSYPNGWAPLHWIVINGLRNYGYHEDADRITYKWLKNCADDYIATKGWAEKLSVVDGTNKTDDPRYAHQGNLFWTWGVFVALYKQLFDN